MLGGFLLRTVNDHLGREVTYSYPPKKIVSFVPAITDTMYNLQLENEVVGRTRFCIYPKGKVEQAVNVGGTKDFKLNRVDELQPDLIICEKEENTREMVEELEKHYPVYCFEVQTVADSLRMIEDLGNITNRKEQAKKLREDIDQSLRSLPKLFSGKRAAYVIWQNPFMVVGKDTYINSVLETIGLTNPFSKKEGRYPEVTEEDFRNEKLDYIFLATEPFPFRNEHVKIFNEINPEANTQIIDGEMFWYGVKMLEAVPYLKEKFS